MGLGKRYLHWRGIGIWGFDSVYILVILRGYLADLLSVDCGSSFRCEQHSLHQFNEQRLTSQGVGVGKQVIQMSDVS